MVPKKWLATSIVLLSLSMGAWYYMSAAPAEKPTRPAGNQQAKPTKKASRSARRYAKLNRLLAAAQWKEADEETSHIMLRTTNRDILGNLDFVGGHNSMKTFSCQKLRAIDSLWVEHSKGRFGFSVQQRIWQQIFEKRNYEDFEEYDEFVLKVGWQENESDRGFKRNFSMEAPQGHFPSFDWMMKTTPSGTPWMQDGVTIFSRIKECQK